MPSLYYGRLEGDKEPRLYSDKLKAFETRIFDHFKINNLAPYKRSEYSGNHWWIRVSKRHPHSAIAWHDPQGYESVILLPGELDWRNTLALAREVFEPLVPSAITFRINNYEGAYLYD